MDGRRVHCENRTVVILGRCGNGKSSVGNSILGRKAFASRACPSSVTLTTQKESTVLPTGEALSIIDTPGLCDLSMGSEQISRELVRCMDLAKEGIHAVLIVFSVTSRFTREEDSAIKMLLKFFGPEIMNHLIVVFTGGDSLEESEESLEDYLDRECPEPLKDLLRICKNRVICFDNRTKDEWKKAAQVQDLVALVHRAVEENGGQPYTHKWFAELQGVASIHLQDDEEDHDIHGLADCRMKARDEQLKGITEMVEAKLQESLSTLQEQLSKERDERAEVERKAKDEMAELMKNLEKAKMQVHDVQQRAAAAEMEAKFVKLKADLAKAERESAERLHRIHELDAITRQPTCVIM